MGNNLKIFKPNCSICLAVYSTQADDLRRQDRTARSPDVLAIRILKDILFLLFKVRLIRLGLGHIAAAHMYI